MKIVKAFFMLLCALALGFVIHYNWEWLARQERVEFFNFQSTQALPIWAYMAISLVLGALFVAVPALRDVLASRKAKRNALLELDELRGQYDSLRGSKGYVKSPSSGGGSPSDNNA